MRLPIPRGRRAILVLGLPAGLAAAAAIVVLTMSPSAAAAPVPDPGDGQHGVMLALDNRVINLQVAPAAPASTYRYAKIGITVELRPTDASYYALTGEARSKAEKDELAKFDDRVPLLMDAIGQVVSSHDAASLTADTGRANLKKELLAAMRAKVGDREVLDIYFTDFVMQ